MKPFCYFFISSFLLISCSYGIFQTQTNYSNEFYDEFKKKQTFVLKQDFTPNEQNTNIQSMLLEFLSEADSNNDIQVFVSLNRISNSQPIESQLYLKINEKDIYVLPLKIVDSKPQEHNITETTTTVSFDTAGVSHSTEATSNRLIRWNSDNYTAIIPSEIIRIIKNSYAVTWRLYSGAIPATFRLNNSKMEKFNCFVNQNAN
jgi:hypothetical protein